MKTIKFLITLLIISFVIMVHELGHAFEMKNQGITVETISLGMDFGFLPSYSFTTNLFPGTAMKISPVLFGGYTKGSTEDFLTLNYEATAKVAASGAKINIITGFAFFLVALLLKGIPTNARTLKVTGALFVGCIISVVFPITFAMIVVPIVGLGMLGYMIVKKGAGLIGPVRIFKMTMKEKTTPQNLIALTAEISIGIGLANVLPIFPLDGGRIALAIIMEYSSVTALAYSLTSLIALLYFFLKITKKEIG